MKKIIILHLLSLNIFSADSQSPYSPKTLIKLGYWASIAEPGFSLGMERPYRYIESKRRRSGKDHIKYKERYLGAAFQMYHHRDFHSLLNIQVEWIQKRQFSGGLYLQRSAGIGLSRTFLAGPTYEVDAQGNIKKKNGQGNYYACIQLAGGIGYNWAVKRNIPWNIYIKPGASVIFPYNYYFLPKPTVELGVIYNVKNFWTAHPKHILKVKIKYSKIKL